MNLAVALLDPLQVQLPVALLHCHAPAAAGKDVPCPFWLRTEYHVLHLLLINTC